MGQARSQLLACLLALPLATGGVVAQAPVQARAPVQAPRLHGALEAGCRSSEGGGAFSRAAVPLYPVYGGCGPVRVRAPDGRSAARIWSDKAERMHLAVHGALGSLTAPIVAGPNHELLWAPDSRAFFLTLNDGGIVGGYDLSVVLRTGGRLRIVDLSKLVRRRFGHPGRCYDPEDPNVVGVGWLGSSHRLVVAAEILPHSNCDRMGTFRAYLVDPHKRRIVAAYKQAEAKRRFRLMIGPELRNADDQCERRPSACWIPDLHLGHSVRKRRS
jgi:hypothetical protein